MKYQVFGILWTVFNLALMLVMGIVFSAVIILVAVIKSFSIDHSRTIAVVTGSVVEAVLVVMSHVMMNLTFSMAGLVAGCVAAVAIGLLLSFFVLSVDYSRTERVQFEDDDYYYYVKAVPKKTVAVREVTVKHFGNTASMGKRIDHSRSVLSPEEEENSRKVIAKELDIDEDLLK